jgi:hypothetical protein
MSLFGFLPILAVETASVATPDGPAYSVDKLSSSPVLQLLHEWGFTGIVDFFQVTRGFESPAAPLAEIFFATILSFLLTGLIGAVYKATFRGAKLSQDYVHTLIILGTVVTFIVLCVREGDSSKAQATAFGMFAAFSIIRFRTTLSEARDIGFIFLAMAAGLAVGARLYGLAVSSVVLVCALIYWFSRRDWFAPNRASHYLRVRVTNDINYDNAFEEVFVKFLEKFDLISVESIQAGMMTELRYNISLKPDQKAGEFVAAIQQVNGNNRILMTSTAPNRTLGTD